MPDTEEMTLILRGYGQTLAEVTYRMPDHLSVLQIFMWQFYEIHPHFPELKKFLRFWEKEIEGPLHSVRFTHQKLIAPTEWRNVGGGLFDLNQLQ